MSLIIIFSFCCHHEPPTCSVDNIPQTTGNETRQDETPEWPVLGLDGEYEDTKVLVSELMWLS